MFFYIQIMVNCQYSKVRNKDGCLPRISPAEMGRLHLSETRLRIGPAVLGDWREAGLRWVWGVEGWLDGVIISGVDTSDTADGGDVGSKLAIPVDACCGECCC